MSVSRNAKGNARVHCESRAAQVHVREPVRRRVQRIPVLRPPPLRRLFPEILEALSQLGAEPVHVLARRAQRRRRREVRHRVRVVARPEAVEHDPAHVLPLPRRHHPRAGHAPTEQHAAEEAHVAVFAQLRVGLERHAHRDGIPRGVQQTLPKLSDALAELRPHVLVHVTPILQAPLPPVGTHGEQRDEHVQHRGDGRSAGVRLSNRVDNLGVSLPAAHHRAPDRDHEVLIRRLDHRVHASAPPGPGHLLAQRSRLDPVRVVDDVADVELGAHLRDVRARVAGPRREARGGRDDAAHVGRTRGFHRGSDGVKVGAQLVADELGRHDDKLEPRGEHRLDAGLLVQAAPHHLGRGLRALGLDGEQHQREGHARGEG
mmetsp:Transcript_15083/g.63464  ORF Transcript_15083/g.63464 Transcript_15083/m.63464 type:complete len:374 (-) Transcript_15083:487-1608(-)